MTPAQHVQRLSLVAKTEGNMEHTESRFRQERERRDLLFTCGERERERQRGERERQTDRQTDRRTNRETDREQCTSEGL